MVGMYGYKPDGDRYWNVRDGDGQFAKGWGMASAVAKAAAKALSQKRLAKINSTLEKSNTLVRTAKGKAPEARAAAKEIREIIKREGNAPNFPSEHAARSLKWLERRASVLEAGNVPTVASLKLPKLEGTPQEVAYYKRVRAKRAKALLEMGHSPETVKNALKGDPKTWPIEPDLEYDAEIKKIAKSAIDQLTKGQAYDLHGNKVGPDVPMSPKQAKAEADFVKNVAIPDIMGEKVASTKKISEVKLPPISGDYSPTEKKKLRAQRRKIGQKMLDNGWQPDQVQNALSGSPTNWPKLSDIKSPKNMAPIQPKEPADSVSKALRTKEKALAMHHEPDPVDEARAKRESWDPMDLSNPWNDLLGHAMIAGYNTSYVGMAQDLQDTIKKMMVDSLTESELKQALDKMGDYEKSAQKLIKKDQKAEALESLKKIRDALESYKPVAESVPEPAPAKAPATPNKPSGVDAPALTLKDLKLPTIEGDGLSAQQKKNLRAQRRKIAQKMIDSGWTKDQILDKLGPDHKTWPALKDVKQATPEDTPKLLPEQPANDWADELLLPEQPANDSFGNANILKNIPGTSEIGLQLHGILNKIEEGTANPAEVEMKLENFDKYKMAAELISNPADRADAKAALSNIEKTLQDHMNSLPVPKAKPQSLAQVYAGKDAAPKSEAQKIKDQLNLQPGDMVTLNDSIDGLKQVKVNSIGETGIYYENTGTGGQSYASFLKLSPAAPTAQSGGNSKMDAAVQHLMDGFLSPDAKGKINKAHNLIKSGASLAQNEQAMLDLHQVKKYEIDYMSEWERDEAESSLALLESALMKQNNQLQIDAAKAKNLTTQIEKLAQGVGGDKALKFLSDEKPKIMAQLVTDMKAGKTQTLVSVPSNDEWGMDTISVNPFTAVVELDKIPNPDLTPEQYTKMGKSLGVKSPDYANFKSLYGDKMGPSTTKKTTATKKATAAKKPAMPKTTVKKSPAASLAEKLNFLMPNELQGKTVDNWPVVGAQKGSNPGALLKDPETGQQHYVKVPKTGTHVASEVLANQLYTAFGVGAPEVTQVQYKGKPATASKIIESSGESVLAKMKDDPQFRKEVQKGFAVDALLGNWDVAGASMDNIIVGKDGKPYRIDNGGSLNYRAQGSKKPGGGLSDNPEELYTLRSPFKNFQAAKLFGSMSNEEIQDSVNGLNQVSDDDLRSMAQSAMPGAEGKKLGDTLVKRKQALIEKAKNLKSVDPLTNKPKIVSGYPLADNKPKDVYQAYMAEGAALGDLEVPTKKGEKLVPFATPMGTPFKLKTSPAPGYTDKTTLSTNKKTTQLPVMTVQTDALEAVLDGKSKADYLGDAAKGMAKPEVQAALAALQDLQEMKAYKSDFLEYFNKLPDDTKPHLKKMFSQMPDHPKYGRFNKWVPSSVPMGEAVPLNPKEGQIYPGVNPKTGEPQPMRLLYYHNGKAYVQPEGGFGSSTAIDPKDLQYPDLDPGLAKKAGEASAKIGDYEKVQKNLQRIYDHVDKGVIQKKAQAEFQAKVQKSAGSAAAYQNLSPEEKAKFAGMANSPRVKKALALKHTEVMGATAKTLKAQSKDTLTPAQFEALKKYTGSHYDAINAVYRPRADNLPPLKNTVKAYAAQIDEVMKKPESRTTQEMIVTRGISLDRFTAAGFGLPYTPKSLQDFLEVKDALVGQIFKDDGYLSTSYATGFNKSNYDYTLHTPAFNKEIRLNIVVPPGTPALNVAKMSATSSKEREIVLDRGGEMVVQNMEIREGRLHVDVVLVSTTNTPKETI